MAPQLQCQQCLCYHCCFTEWLKASKGQKLCGGKRRKNYHLLFQSSTTGSKRRTDNPVSQRRIDNVEEYGFLWQDSLSEAGEEKMSIVW